MTGKKQIFVNGKLYTASVEGMPRVGRELILEFDSLLGEDEFGELEVTVVIPGSTQERVEFRNLKVVRVGHFRGPIWEQLELPLYVKRGYLLNFTGTAPLLKRNGAVVIHDAQFRSTPASHNFKSRILYNIITPTVCRRYKDLISVSNYALDEINRFGVSARTDFKVIPNAADHVLRAVASESVLHKYGLTNRSYILSNGYAHAHKNIQILFQVAELRQEFADSIVLFGSARREDFVSRGIPVPTGIRFIGRISDTELISLITHARLFAFPSLTEGFGLPPLEAMQLGCPTVCSSRGAMTEICEGGVAYANPTDPNSWVHQFERIFRDKAYADFLSLSGKVVAAKYSWRESARSYLSYIAESIESLPSDI